MLARGGVPMLLIWAALQISWGFSVMQAYIMSWRARRKPWPGVFLFLLAFWFAFLINGSFDVFLEGPMGGIWFWSVFGTGLAAVWIYRHDPDVLQPATGSRMAIT